MTLEISDDNMFMIRVVSVRRRVKKWVWISLMIICLIILGFTIFNTFNWDKDNKKTEIQVKEIEEITEITEIPASDKDEILSDYYKYINLPLISVDFSKLMEKNKDTVGFIKVNNTNINYPVVQTKDNNYYLNHSYDKSYNNAGWVFLDYRNDINNFQDNTIVYGHGRYDKTMFGTLKNALNEDLFKNNDNHIVYLSTPYKNTLWEVFSIYKVPTETYYLTSSFGSLKSKQEFINTLLKRSKYDFGTKVSVDDKILTLSTCFDNNNKVVLHAKLVKGQTRQ